MANENAQQSASGEQQQQTQQPAGEQQQQQPTQPQGAVAPEWIPEDLRSHKSLTKFKTAGEAAKAYVNLESMLGKRIEIPGDDASPEVKAAFRTKLGVPEKADDYENPAVPEGQQLDAGLFGDFKKIAHEAGIPKAAAKKLADWYVGLEQRRMTEFAARTEKAKAEGMKALHAQWGGATSDNVGIIQRLVAETGDQDLKEALERTGFGNDPAGLRWLAKIGRNLMENDLIDPAGLGTGMEDARAEIAKIQGEASKDRKHPLRNTAHPEHKSLKKKMETLYSIAYPDVEMSVDVV